MLWRNLLNLVENVREVRVTVKNEYSSLCVTPTHVRKQLVNRFEELLLAFPELAFSDKEILVSLTD
jgi:hypothetical protein